MQLEIFTSMTSAPELLSASSRLEVLATPVQMTRQALPSIYFDGLRRGQSKRILFPLAIPSCTPRIAANNYRNLGAPPPK